MIGTAVYAGALGCSTPPAQTAAAPATANLIVTNHTSGRLEVYLVATQGQARLLGQLGAGKVGQYSAAPNTTVSAYLGSGITRTMVPCSFPREESGTMKVDCGKQ